MVEMLVTGSFKVENKRLRETQCRGLRNSGEDLGTGEMNIACLAFPI